MVKGIFDCKPQFATFNFKCGKPQKIWQTNLKSHFAMRNGNLPHFQSMICRAKKRFGKVRALGANQILNNLVKVA